MSAQWTGDLVGKMHGKITHIELANYLGIHPKYLSAVLNGRRCPKNAQERYERAVDEILAEKGSKD